MAKTRNSQNERENNADSVMKTKLTLPSKSKSRKIEIKKGIKKPEKRFSCLSKGCSFNTNTYDNLCEHRNNVHYCSSCECSCLSLVHHKCKKKKDDTPMPEIDIKNTLFSEKAKANKGAVVSLTHLYQTNEINVRSALDLVYDDLYKILQYYLALYKGIRTKFVFKLDVTELKTEDRKIKFYQSNYTRITNRIFIEEVVLANLDYVTNVIDMLTETGSGIKIEGILSLDVDIVVYQPVRPRGYAKIPKGLRRRQGLLNIKCESGCFRLCILAALFGDQVKLTKYPNVNRKELTAMQRQTLKIKMQRPELYFDIINKVRKEALIDFNGYENEIDFTNLSQWEEKNKISVTVYQYDEDTKNVKAFRYTPYKFEQHVDLLLIGEENDSHLVLIQDNSRFFGKIDIRKRKTCPHCSVQYTGTRHEQSCKQINEPGLKMPPPDRRRFKFRDLHKCLPPPYRIYSDLLYYLDDNEQTNPLKVAGFGIAVVGPSGELVDKLFYIGPDAMKFFLDYIFYLAKSIFNKTKNDNLPIPEMTYFEKEKFDNATKCEICHQEFTQDNIKVRHHSHHIPGFPVMAVCQNDNLQIKAKQFIPLYSHTHHKMGNQMILQSIKEKHKKNINVIPKSNENFMALEFDKILKVMDSKKLLDFPLQDLILRLVQSQNISKLEPYYTELDESILKKPFYFPHTWFTSIQKLKEKNLPPKAEFTDILSDKEIGEKEYKHSLDLFQQLKCNNFYEYCVAYLKSRVFQLAAAMEEFGEWCFKTYQLSPLGDISLASYAYSVATYHARTDFEIPSDKHMVEHILNNIRGGVSHLAKRIVTAKSERLGNANVSDNERTEIIIADVNGLYQFCLMQPMPYQGYRNLSKDELLYMDVLNLNGDNGKGWIITVSLEYPPEVKEKTLDYPLCPTKEKIDWSYLVESRKEMEDACQPSSSQQFGVHGLLLTHLPKTNIPIYYKLLQFYLRQGLKITTIHEAIEFEERAYLKSFIEHNINIRKNAHDKFHESISKSIGNMVFGKFLSVNNNLNVEAVTSKQQAIKSFSRHDFVDCRIVSEDLSLVYKARNSCTLNKNIFVSFVVLDLAKLHLYEIIYDILKPKFGDKMYVCASETDNLVIELKVPDNNYLQDLKDIEYIFDFSTLPKDHPLYNTSRAKEPGLLKIEHPYPLQFVGVKSKLYSIINRCEKCLKNISHDGYLSCESCNENIPKGCPRRKKTPHQTYVQAAMENTDDTADFMTISSKNQQVTAENIKKKIFSTRDNHRIWLTYNYSVPYGYV